MKKVAIIAVFVLLTFVTLPLVIRKRPSVGLDLLFHSQGITISRIEIAGYRSGAPVSAIFSNKTELDYFAECFQNSQRNDSHSGQYFEGRVLLNHGGPIVVFFLIPGDLSYLVIGESTFLDLKDPSTIFVPLQRPIPAAVKQSLARLLPDRQ